MSVEYKVCQRCNTKMRGEIFGSLNERLVQAAPISGNHGQLITRLNLIFWSLGIRLPMSCNDVFSILSYKDLTFINFGPIYANIFPSVNCLKSFRRFQNILRMQRTQERDRMCNLEDVSNYSSCIVCILKTKYVRKLSEHSVSLEKQQCELQYYTESKSRLD